MIRQDWVCKIRTNASLVCLEKENVLPLVRDHFSYRLAKKKKKSALPSPRNGAFASRLEMNCVLALTTVYHELVKVRKSATSLRSRNNF